MKVQHTLHLIAEPVFIEYRDAGLHLRRALTGIDVHGKIGAPQATLEHLARQTVDLSDFTGGAIAGRGYLTNHRGEECDIVVDGGVMRGDGFTLYGGSINWCFGVPFLEEYNAVWAEPSESVAAVQEIEERANIAGYPR